MGINREGRFSEKYSVSGTKRGTGRDYRQKSSSEEGNVHLSRRLYCRIRIGMERGSSGRKDSVGFDRSPASDLWRNTLSQIPTTYGRLVFFSTMRDQDTGRYTHYGFAQRVGDETAHETMKQSHLQCFSEWLNFSLEEQKADLDLYLSGIDSDKRTILETWTRTKPYRYLIPAAAPEFERSLYNSDLETLLELLTTVHGVASPDQTS
jgi:hypothetical protein